MVGQSLHCSQKRLLALARLFRASCRIKEIGCYPPAIAFCRTLKTKNASTALSARIA